MEEGQNCLSNGGMQHLPRPSSPSRQGLSWSQSVEMNYSYEENRSQEPSQTQTEVLTQNVELTQLGDEDASSGVLSPLPPYSPSALRNIPWGLFMPCGKEGERTRWELKPKDVEGRGNTPRQDGIGSSGTVGVSVMGLRNIQASDVFNLHTMGRSQKADLIVPRVVPASKEDAKIYNWAYAMISNQHLKIYCTLNDATGHDISVWIEDTSGNGTLVNQATLLRRGERRLLNSGDEICVINPAILRRKVRSQTMLAQVLQQFSFVFVRQQPRQPLGGTVLLTHFSGISPWRQPSSARKVAVNARATNGRDPLAETDAPMGRRRIEDDYEIRDVIGEGTAGLVRRAIHRRTGEARAVKMIRIQKRSFASGASSAMADVQAEAKILQDISHPYIVKFDDFYLTDSAVCLVMELLPGGDLFDRIVDKGRYAETESRRVMRRVLAAVHYLHEEQNIVHRDLKPENILLMSRTNDVQVKLTDFGLAKTVNDEGCKTFCGTPQYFAPEVLRRQHTVKGRGRYGKPADMWSLGVILYVLLSGTQPFEDGLMLDFPASNWSHVSESAKDLVRRLLQRQENCRLTIKQACEHKWILTADGDTHTHPLCDPIVASRGSAHSKGNEQRPDGPVKVKDKHESEAFSEKPNAQKHQSSPSKHRMQPPCVESPASAISFKSKPIPSFQSPDVLPLEKLRDPSSPTSSTDQGAEKTIPPRHAAKSARVSDETEARRPLSPTSFNTRSEPPSSSARHFVLSHVPTGRSNAEGDADHEIESFEDAEESISSFATTEEETKSLAAAAKREQFASKPSRKPKRRRRNQSSGDSLAALVKDETQTTLSSWLTPSSNSSSNKKA